MEMYSKTQVLNMVEREVNKLRPLFFKEMSNHEFFDTCDIYKLLARLKNPKKTKKESPKE